MKLIIDADACPKAVLACCLEAGKRYGISVITVASFNHQIASDEHITVGNASQEADLKIVNLTEANDLVITQDWGLAALALAKKACCVSPSGSEYRSEKMDFLLEEREIKAKVRRGGGRTKGPRKRQAEDDARFAASLERLLRQLTDRSS
ncbi:YaiI/YqxD family protein [Anaeroarcus burkinensis]|uniref:YaiI/YqxD family protein n=1 Tax=Anaeroarcus burkinensis TaxID=82376 RepID=UPI000428922E|nr:DUF188 domain-containing protein [Anaeroarcus burkinensis]